MSHTVIENLTRGTVIADRAEVARSLLARGRGLMGRPNLPAGYGLILVPESSIHMFFMRIPIDVLFVDRQHRVIGMREALPPWHPFAGVAPWRGYYVVELPVGAIRSSRTGVGDQLRVTPDLDQ
ncbi:DUF192 domain-containing protein [Roseiflexus sp.]|jgi:uncharacterized membrane protein (UPF0127 family)|uniref:DUF192 domain-containing protein n=1 Tax=Roseiflexus sp. TaxID=2562120 RepID=UPI0025F0892D|nr:DUF192 domain-containing protein [Roseiflexus sp.]MCL6541846.1 DUF192 domain-containing protein [Roseiflexus sp.]